MNTNTLPFVTIGIPFYNAQATLLNAVRSVFAQTHQRWELILIDDGSTDQSLKIAHSINDSRVQVVSDGQNNKLASRLNQLVELAEYDFIARMDADDMMTPDRIEILMHLLHSNRDYDLASCGTYSIKDDGGFNGYRGSDEQHYTFKGLLNKSQNFLHAGLVAHKSWYERNRYDESLPLGQDSELWLRTAKAGDFRAISTKQPLYMYREEHNVTKDKLLKAYKIERYHHAPLIKNKYERLKYTGKSIAKTSIVKVMAATGTLEHLLARRNQTLKDDALIDSFNQAIHSIYNTKIPGVDDD